MRHDEHVAGAHGPSQDARVGGTVAGRYRVVERIAAGGFGAIYRATDVITGHELALKILHTHLVGDPAIVARFVREAELLASLRGAHAVTVYGHGFTSEGAPFLAMELLRGETLHARFIARGALPWREVVAIARGVCSALAEPHALGIVHRDLKPANILLERRGRFHDFVRVLDFGIAKRGEAEATDGDLTQQGELLGTFDYMAPEQILGGRTSPQADIFALGVVMYEMIAAMRPYGEQVLSLAAGDPIPLSSLADIPEQLQRVIAHCLQREPHHRFTSIAELDGELAQILDDEADTVALAMGAHEEDTWIGPLPFAPTLPVVTDPVRVRGSHVELAEPRARFAHGTSPLPESEPTPKRRTLPSTPSVPSPVGPIPPQPEAIAAGTPFPDVARPVSRPRAVMLRLPADEVVAAKHPPAPQSALGTIVIAIAALLLGTGVTLLVFGR